MHIRTSRYSPPPPPALPPESHPSRAPAALLDTAFRLFAARGYGAVRLEDVAEAAGMTKGAIYYHFEGKEDLLRRALQHRHRTMFAKIARAGRAQRGPASSKIRMLLRKVWERWVEPGWGQAFRLLVGEVSVEFPAIFRVWSEEGPLEGWALLRALIEEGIAAGEFRRDVDAEVAARWVYSGSLLQAALGVHLGLDELAPCDDHRLLESAVDLFLHGLSVTHQLPPEMQEPGRPGVGREEYG